MYFIYKITNKINNKSYIGSSDTNRGIYTRWEEHIKASKNPKNKSYNYPLQKSIRKRGENNFTYTILEIKEGDTLERAERESYYINKYNTMVNTGWGYNQTEYTFCALTDPLIKKQQIEKTSKKCALVDKNEKIIKIFPSLHEAAKYANCENCVSTITKICNGEMRSINKMIFRWVDNDGQVIIPNFRTREKRIPICAISLIDQDNILIFESILDASKQLSLDRSSIQACLRGEKRYSNVGGYVFRKYNPITKEPEKNNIPLEEALSKYIGINNDYKTFMEWCKYLNISRQSIYNRMKKYNLSKKEALLYYYNKKRG